MQPFEIAKGQKSEQDKNEEGEGSDWDMIGEEDKINEDPNESDDSGNIADEMEEISDDGRFSRTSGA